MLSNILKSAPMVKKSISNAYFPSKPFHRAQSAMEYLMTYGWAILIIAVVLGALFSLGVFSGNALLGNACVAQSGFLCQNPVYSHTSGNIIVTLGQNTGTNWAGANFVFAPQGTPTVAGIPGTSVSFNSFPANMIYSTNAITSGQTLGIWLPVNGISGIPVPVGTTATGTIWAVYYTSTGPGAVAQYTQIAAINIKAS